MLKGRFRILGKDRILRYSPQKSGVIINSCAVLHNIMVDAGITVDDIEIDIDGEFENNELRYDNADINIIQRGIHTRRTLIEQFFNH